MYDPALGRWHVPDPLAEYHFNMNPYHYVENNPIRYIDPFGLDKEDRERRRRERRERRERKKYEDPDNNEYYLPEVSVTAKRRQSKGEAREQAKNDNRTWGIFWFGEEGTNGTNKNADGIWMDFDPLKWIKLWAKQKSFEKKNKPSKEEQAKRTGKAASEATSDEEIIEESASNNAELIKKEIDKRSGIVKYQGEEGDSIVKPFCVLHDPGGDSTLLRDKKIHNQSRKGRWISSPYLEKSKNE